MASEKYTRLRGLFLRETEEREEWELGLKDEAHCQCAACSERSYRSVKDSMEEKKNIDRIEPPSRSFKLQSSTFKLGDAAGMNPNYCAGGGFKVQREQTTVCLLRFQPF